ncbi:terminase large subunit domain-containing protein [Clostridium haemolyticum]|uniref:Prophage terminase, ATP subunit n=1 Tax=Clostridium haemolyticum NCTC 9693 TaxID=1443114 RepID=A0ABR4TB81_CLOHA|nr:terminase family protein [Clostridium haemolyticum]KEI14167.1 prophage terminase, ATP subunit [Clostridium haemolyticum NCTC 9693]
MASYTNYKVDNQKYSQTKDIFKKNAKVNNTVENMSKNEKMRYKIKLWTTFYRLNMHRFVESYFQIELHLFQKIILYLMHINTVFMLVASRGISKSFTIAIYCCARSVLYPNSKIILASGTKGQAKLIITEKIEKELMQYPNLAREIKQIKSSSNEATVVFQNGSTITAVPSTQNARGYRGNCIILEEFRMIDKKILESVLLPMLNVFRQPPYLKKEEYKHLTEENVEIYISSAWYKGSHWMWGAMQSTRDLMLKGKDACFMALDYLLAIHHGLLSKKRIEKEKMKSDFDSILFLMEYENVMYGQNENALFKLDDIQKNRILKKAFYPVNNFDYSSNKKKQKKEGLKSGEIRIIGVDCALMGGTENDATVFTCMRLIPSGDRYIRKIPYIETMEGQHSQNQAIRLKQLFNDFQASYVAIDCHGNGMAIYDECVKVLYDEERDIEYDAWCSYNDEEMKKRALSPNPLPVVFSIKAGQRLNHELATALRTDLQQGNIELLINELEAKDMLSEKKEYEKLPPEEKSKILTPFLQTTALLNELVNLEFDIVGGYIKVKEKSGKRKDRYSSIAFANYLGRLLEKELYDEDEEDDDPLVYYI